MNAFEADGLDGVDSGAGSMADESHFSDTRPLRPVPLPEREAGAMEADEENGLDAQFADTGPLPALSPAVMQAMADLEANEAPPEEEESVAESAEEIAATIAAVTTAVEQGETDAGYDASYFADTGPLPAVRPADGEDVDFDPFADTGPLPDVADNPQFFDTRPLRPLSGPGPQATLADDESE